jgi:hypothetical protein
MEIIVRMQLEYNQHEYLFAIMEAVQMAEMEMAAAENLEEEKNNKVILAYLLIPQQIRS